MNVTCLTEVFDSFALSSAIAEGKSDLALRILGTLKAQKAEPVAILGELSRTLSDMLAIKIMAGAGLPPKEIAGTLKVHEYKVKLYLGNVRELSAKKLSRALDLCVEADSALKLSGSGYVELEKLICTL